MKRILFVEGEPGLGAALVRVLQSSRLEWEVDLVNSGSQAIDAIEFKPYEALICAINLADIPGLQVLKAARDISPQTLRIALASTVYREMGIEAAKYAHQIIIVPTEAEEVVSILQRAFILEAPFVQDDLKKIIARLNKLPSLPALYVAIMEEVQSQHTSVERIGAIIERDPGMSAKILQIVNSAFFGLKQTISNPVQATSFLGVETIRDLALSMSIFAQFNSQLIKELGLGMLWDHSTTTGFFARTIAHIENQSKNITGDAFTAGILHDVGKLILAENLPRQYYTALRLASSKNKPQFEAEREVFGVSHAEVGAYLLGIWGLPDGVVDTVAYHHTPAKYDSHIYLPLIAVHVANTLDHHLHPRNAQSRVRGFDMDYLTRLGLSSHLPVWEEECARYVEGQGKSSN